MALPAYSTRFIGENVTAGGGPVTVTVPAGKRWVVGHASFILVTGLPDSFVFVTAPGGYLWSVNASVDGPRVQHEFHQVLNSGETLTVQVAGPDDYEWSVFISGWELFNNP